MSLSASAMQFTSPNGRLCATFDLDADGRPTYSLLADGETVIRASPDYQHGAAQEVDFEYVGGQVKMNIPALQYWTMIVIEK